MLGKEMEEFVACDKFQPTEMDGQLCYSLDLSKVDNRNKSGTGKSSSLLIILDSNTNEDHTFARIIINTLSPFTDSRNGSYALSALKKMTGTQVFLEIPDNVKECQVEMLEKCNNMKYHEVIQKKCGCVLWATSLKEQVWLGLFHVLD